MDPNSLVARVLKGKYYPSHTFMESTKLSYGSYGWTGILAGRDVLKLGLGWIVGDGNNINVWNDAWLSTSLPLRPFGPPPKELLDLKVTDLINSNSKSWDVEAIRRYLPHYEEIITSIVLSSYSLEDSLAWLPVKSGLYTTKSSYALSKLNMVATGNEVFDWKSCIWQVNTSPKLKHFLWKLKHKALAVGQNLMSRGVMDIVKCKHCDGEENELHVIYHCPFAETVWSLVPVLFKPDANTTTINQFLTAARRQVNLPPSGLTEAPLYPWIIWNLWKARNLLVFENRRIAARELVTGAIKEARTWYGAQVKTRKQPRTSPVDPQQVNYPNLVLCFTDASWQAASRESGLGWCFRDSSSNIITQQSASCKNVASALIAEALAMKAALIVATSAGHRVLTVFSDSQSLVTLINFNGVINELKSLLYDIRCLGESFTSISFVFIRRTANVVADALAKLALVS